MENPNPPPSRRRRRPALACEPCRRKKVRCDRTVPCEHCSHSRTDICTYLMDEDQNNESTNNNSSENSSQQLKKSSGITKNIEFNGTVAAERTATSSPRNTAQTSYFSLPTPRPEFSTGYIRKQDPATTSYETQLPTPLTAPGLRVGRAGLRQCDSVDNTSGSGSGSSQTYEERSSTIQGIFSKSRYFGQSHWMNSLYQFPQVLEIISRLEGDESSEIRATFRKCKNLSKTIRTGESICSPFGTDCYDLVPSKTVADPLIQAYLRTFESVFRVIHTSSFLREYNDYWMSPRAASPEFIFKLLLMMAIGTSFAPDQSEPLAFRGIASQWIYAAQAWLSSPFEKSRINISGVQIHCLLLIARLTNGIGGDLIYISTGSLLKTALHMGLHIDPSHCPAMSFFDGEIRRRLWASVLELVTQSSMDAGGSPLITNADFNCERPSNLDDDQFDESTMEAPTPRPLTQFTQSSVQVSLMNSLPVRLDVARFINDFRFEPDGTSYEDTLRLGTRLSGHCRANSALFQNFRSDKPHPSSFQIKLLDLLTHRFLLALHHPFAMKAKTSPTFYFSRKVSLEISLSLLPRFQAGSNRFQDDDYARLRLIGTGAFRDVPVQATSTICEEVINQLEEEKSSFTPVSSSFSRKDLRKAIEEYCELTALRIKHGETNVKGHVVFSCLLAQVDALQAGQAVEPAISKAVARSLDSCHRMLKSRSEEGKAKDLREMDSVLNGGRPAVDNEQDWFPRDDIMQDEGVDFESWLSSSLLPKVGSV